MTHILIVTGEASGDIHGAHLARALQELHPAIVLTGVGGSKMSEAGVTLLPHFERVDAMGVPGIRQLLKGWKTLRLLSRYIRQTRFDAVILIDSPGLNLRLAKKIANRHHARLYYYVAPQVWAWGERRIKLIRRVIDHVLAILPFEEDYFRKAGVNCTFVGHPLLDDMRQSYDQTCIRQQLNMGATGPVVGLLPGSRLREVQTILPVLLQAIQQIRTRHPSLQVILAQAHTVSDALLHEMITRSGETVQIVKNRTNEVMASADLLLIASGTATLQAALIGTPMVVVYRTSSLTYQIARRLVKIPHISLVNILAGREIVPELIQHRMTADQIVRESTTLLQDADRQREMTRAFHMIRHSLGGPGASRRAAALILAEVGP